MPGPYSGARRLPRAPGVRRFLPSPPNVRGFRPGVQLAFTVTVLAVPAARACTVPAAESQARVTWCSRVANRAVKIAAELQVRGMGVPVPLGVFRFTNIPSCHLPAAWDRGFAMT